LGLRKLGSTGIKFIPKSIGETKLLSDVSIVWGDRFRFEESSENYITSVQSEEKAENGKCLVPKILVNLNLCTRRRTVYYFNSQLVANGGFWSGYAEI
jgi:hypothetical protein